MTTIHITCWEAVAAALRETDRASRVIALHDDLTVGPLRHADESANDRVAFWQRVGGLAETVLRGEAAMFDALEEGEAPVVIWHTPDAADQLALRRVCYRLRNAPQRLNEVRLSAADATPAHVAARLADAAPISVLRITRLALEWQEARFANGETRRWRDNTFTSGTFAELDTLIVDLVDAARGEWLSPPRIGAALPGAGAGFTAGEPVVLWRLRELAANGALRLRDDLHAARAPGATTARAGAAAGVPLSAAHLSLPR